MLVGWLENRDFCLEKEELFGEIWQREINTHVHFIYFNTCSKGRGAFAPQTHPLKPNKQPQLGSTSVNKKYKNH